MLSLNDPQQQKVRKYAKSTSFLFLASLTLFCFYPAFDNEFVFWDDQFYITANPLIQNPTWESLKSLSTKIISLNYHPLTMTTLWFNAKLWGIASAKPFIMTNILLHGLNTILVYLFSVRLFKKQNLLALIVACIFCVHPMHVESVVWVSERKDVLYSLFFLLSLLSYIRFISKDHSKFYILSLVLFICACLSKAMAVSLIPVIILIDHYRGTSLCVAQTYLNKIPFIFIGILFGVIAVDVQNGGDFYGILDSTIQEAALHNGYTGWIQKAKLFSFGLSYYLNNFLWPTNLSAFHPYSLITDDPLTLPSLLISTAFFSVLVWAMFRNKIIFFGLSFYLVTIGLVLQVIPVGSAIVAERYTYLPYIGIATVIAEFIKNLSKRINPKIIFMLSGTWIMALTIVTRKQCDVWQNHSSLFENVVDKYPRDGQARKFLASGYWQTNQLDLAIAQIDYAINHLDYATSESFELIANCYADKGELEQATNLYHKAIELDKTNITARYHRALTLLDQDPVKAIMDLDFCEQSDNEYVKNLIYLPRARAHGMLKNYDQAIKDFNKAIHFFPNDGMNYVDRATTYELMGNYQMAIANYEMALSIDPTLVIASQKIKQLIPFIKAENNPKNIPLQ